MVGDGDGPGVRAQMCDTRRSRRRREQRILSSSSASLHYMMSLDDSDES